MEGEPSVTAATSLSPPSPLGWLRLLSTSRPVNSHYPWASIVCGGAGRKQGWVGGFSAGKNVHLRHLHTQAGLRPAGPALREVFPVGSQNAQPTDSHSCPRHRSGTPQAPPSTSSPAKHTRVGTGRMTSGKSTCSLHHSLANVYGGGGLGQVTQAP